MKDEHIYIRNIYYMLAYAFDHLIPEDEKKIAGEEFEKVQDILAAILSLGIGRQIKQGLYREYRNYKEDLSVMRGKIDMPGTIRNQIARKQRLTCEYDELTDDNLFNQILKTTVILLLRHGDVQDKYKQELKKEMLYFSNVSRIEPGDIRWDALRFQRNNQSYRMLLGICRMVLEDLLLTMEDGEYKLSAFKDIMANHGLFERFVRAYYAKEHPELKTSDAGVPWAVDDEYTAGLPGMHTDITLVDRKNPGRVLIIDTKYYRKGVMKDHQGSRKFSSGNIYQIFAYVKNMDAGFGDRPHEVSGMLLYARTDEEIQPDNVYHMSGNKISVRTLDLNVEFEKIREQLDGIAAEHFPNVSGKQAVG